jgi:hypothetical protein
MAIWQRLATATAVTAVVPAPVAAVAAVAIYTMLVQAAAAPAPQPVGAIRAAVLLVEWAYAGAGAVLAAMVATYNVVAGAVACVVARAVVTKPPS